MIPYVLTARIESMTCYRGLFFILKQVILHVDSDMPFHFSDTSYTFPDRFVYLLDNLRIYLLTYATSLEKNAETNKIFSWLKMVLKLLVTRDPSGLSVIQNDV